MSRTERLLENSPNIRKLSSTSVNKMASGEPHKYFELNETKNTTGLNLWNTVKSVLEDL